MYVPKTPIESSGDRIRRLRIARSMTQQQLADVETLKVQRNLVNYWENDEREIKGKHLVALAELFNVSTDYILRGIDPEHIDAFQKTGIREDAIQWFADTKDKYPLYIEAFNALFENKADGGLLADQLFSTLARYATSKYVTLKEQNHALGISAGHPREREMEYEESAALLLYRAQYEFANIVVALAKRWDGGVSELMDMHKKNAEAEFARMEARLNGEHPQE